MVTLLTRLYVLVGRRGEDEGATMLEYGLLITLVAAVVAISAAAFGARVATLFTVGTVVP